VSDFVLDLDDKEVRVGDRIAYSVTTGRSANVRIGTVVEIVWAHEKEDRWGYKDKKPTKLRVQVEKSSFAELWSDKPTLIEAGFKRFVKLV
jgi:hypothetical protein